VPLDPEQVLRAEPPENHALYLSAVRLDRERAGMPRRLPRNFFALTTRSEALKPIRQGVRGHFGDFAPGIARRLAVQHNHSSRYMSDAFSDAFRKELRFLCIASSPAFVCVPESNGCAERFIRTLKDNLLWLRTFDIVEQLRRALLEFH